MKTWTVVIISVVVALGVGIGMWFIFVAPAQEKAVENENIASYWEDKNAKSDSIATAKKSEADEYSNQAREYSALYDRVKEELDTIRPLALAADSIKTVAANLQKKLTAALATNKKSPSAKNAAVVAEIQKKLKGNPVVNDTDKTFTYVASDSALVATLAPDGYKLVKKPR